MSVISFAARPGLGAVLMLAISTAAGAALAGPAHAEPAPSISASGSAPATTGASGPPSAPTTTDPAPAPPLSANYRLRPTAVRPGQDVTLIESDVVGDDSPPVFIFRYVTWGDGTPEEFFSTADRPRPHRYARPGTYRVSVRLQNLDLTARGTFPDGNTVTVRAASSPPAVPPQDGGGGRLPETGPRTGWVAGVGVGALLVGAAMVVVFRRRRLHFVR